MSDNSINECPNCGAPMGVHDKCCKYCGTANKNYKAPFAKANSDLNNMIKTGTDDLKQSDVNVVVLVLLLVFCWPVGLIYLLVKTAK